ncbi:hypothetical protein [Rhodovulum steppense]|uniref:Uncharacterized protein n=1 Tax=Rhodovulum steppense TaxID=540251 RepID=A0A4V2R371_9RHOB|nr:hypothetical protein [Rhodovulum steppense]TCM75234.1 hypothetical protein EV216_1412 [Rhodovulum steppense]
MRSILAIQVWLAAMALPATLLARDAPGAKWLVAPAVEPLSAEPPVAAPALPGFTTEAGPDPAMIGLALAVLGLAAGIFVLGRLIGFLRARYLSAGGRSGRRGDRFSQLSADADRR